MTIIFDVDRSSSTQVTLKVQPPVAPEVRSQAPRRNPIEDSLRAELGVSRPSRSAPFHWADVVQLNIEKLEGKLAFLMVNKPFENGATIKVVKSMLDVWKAIPSELVRTPAASQVQAQSATRAPVESLETQLRNLTGCKRPSAQAPVHFREFVMEQVTKLRAYLDEGCLHAPDLFTLAEEWLTEWKAIPEEKLVDGRKHAASPGDSGGPMNAANQSVNYSRFPLATFMNERNIAFLGRDWPLSNELDVDILRDAETSARAMLHRIDEAGLELRQSSTFAAYTPEARAFADNKLASAYAQWEKYLAFLDKRAAFRTKEDEKRSKLDFNLDGRGNSGGSAASRARKAAISSRDAEIRAGLKGGAGKGKK